MIPHLFPLHPDGAKAPFFLCAPAGGVLFPCYSVLKLWDPERPFYAIQDPSLNKDVPVFRKIEDLARANIAVMKTIQPEGPYLLGGWSFGAMVSLEMAQQLIAAGEQVDLMLVLDMRVNGPGRESPFANMSAAQKLIAIPKLLIAVFSHTGPYFRDGIYVLSTDVALRCSGMKAALARFGLKLVGNAPIARVLEERPHLKGVQPPGLFRCFRVLGANMMSLRHYKPQPLAAPCALVKASDSASLGLHDDDPTMGWGGIATQGLATYDTPGNHVTLMLEPAISVVAESLLKALESADELEPVSQT